jgi:KUP system potassium uptake protein
VRSFKSKKGLSLPVIHLVPQVDKVTVSPGGIIKSMGLVFGDIGTSPIYTLTAIFLLIPATRSNILGILSLIIWTLTILVTVEYTFLAMHLGNKGEGGSIVLKEILLPLLTSGNQIAFVSLLTIVGISLFIGDGIITPAISLLSAVEGIILIPDFSQLPQSTLIAIAAVIAILLFLFQARGSERVAFAFGPIMVLWFGSLAFVGAVAIFSAPEVFLAINPLFAWHYLTHNGIEGFFILSSVILCATGGEALFADMGHLGREPIINAWYIVFVALAINYLGQGAFLLSHPGTKNILFEMVFTTFQSLYVPFLVLSIAATIIASQAMISGLFSVVYQGITTRIFPLLRIEYTSIRLRSQIYIDVVNWLLMISVLFVMVIFQTSNNLTLAYGLAVSGTMAITGIMICWIFFKKGLIGKFLLACFVFAINLVFLISTMNKIPLGGYWSLIFASIPFAIIMIYIRGQERMGKVLQPVPFDDFLTKFKIIYTSAPRIKGTALFFARDFRRIPQYIPRTMFANGIIYDENIVVSIIRTEKPFGITWGLIRDLTEGLSIFEIYIGYIEIVDIDSIFREAGIEEKTIFYGMEEIISNATVWRIFAIIKRLSPSVVQFYKLPPDKIHGVVTRIEM